MKNSFLYEKLIDLQNEYKELLKNISISLSQSWKQCIDEINIFWVKNKKLVECALKYLFKNANTYVFTGATYLDIENGEHYPFLTIGKNHLLDDPICLYKEYISGKFTYEYENLIKNQLCTAIKDNIKILETLNDRIIILPIRFLFSVDKKMIYSAADKAFLSLFKNELTMEKYFKEFKDLDDILTNIDTRLLNKLIFHIDDNPKEELSKRLKSYKNSTTLPIKEPNEIQLFYLAVYGPFAQVFDILFLCVEFNLLPYLRYNVAVSNLLFLSANFKENEIRRIIFASFVSFMLYKKIDMNLVHKIHIEDYIKELNETNFYDKALCFIENNYVNLDKIKPNKINKFLYKNLKYLKV